jgi:ribonuclease HII
VLYFERKFRKKGFTFIIGVDEAGRGPLAGPVVAAAAFLSTYRFQNRIDDSKKLTPTQRENAFHEIIQKSLFGIGVVNEKIIDRLNIAVATRIAMEEAIRKLSEKLPRCQEGDIHVLVDGDIRPFIHLSCTNIIRGDGRSKSIACASIIAKVTRDRIMSIYDTVYPRYGFLRHKGYPTKSHKLAIKKFGPSRIHRTTFCSV